MSETLDPAIALPGQDAEVVPDPPRPRRRNRVPRIKPWWIRTHRWVSLTVGLLLLAECVSGAVLLMRPEIDLVAHPERYEHTTSSNPLTAAQAVALVNAQDPGIEAGSAFGFHGVWMVSGDGPTTAYVDPGSRRIVAEDDGDGFFLSLMAQVHDCFFACEGSPAYLAFMAAPLFGSDDYTVASFLLGVLALALTFLAISGLITWWPALRKWGAAVRVRLRRGPYARDLDLHKLIGILAMPLLLMWGITGMTYVGWEWPTDVYYALVPGGAADSGDDPTPGTGPMLSLAQAETAALAAVPGGHVIAVRSYDPEKPDGTYLINVDRESDISRDVLELGASIYVTVDAHGGGISPVPELNGWQEFWDKDLIALHTGGNMSTVPRILLEVTSGLAIVPLAVTGITVWITRWRSRRNRGAARRARRAAAGSGASAGQ